METGEKALYRRKSSDYHTLRYVRWLEKQIENHCPALNTEHMIEKISAEVHKAWWREKEAQGFHPPLKCKNWPLPHGKEESWDAVRNKHCEKCHPDMYPYEELPEHVKEYDRVTVRAVLEAMNKITD